MDSTGEKYLTTYIQTMILHQKLYHCSGLSAFIYPPLREVRISIMSNHITTHTSITKQQSETQRTTYNIPLELLLKAKKHNKKNRQTTNAEKINDEI